MSNGGGSDGVSALGQFLTWLVMKQAKGNKALGCLYALLDLAVLVAVLYVIYLIVN